MTNSLYVFKIVLALIVVCSETISMYRAQQLDLQEGEVCSQKANENSSSDYICKRAKNCASLVENIKRQIYPRICSFTGNEPIVCCSPVTNKVMNSIPVRPAAAAAAAVVTSSYSAAEMCRQYSELVYTNTSVVATGLTGNGGRTLDCHNVLTLIVGGTRAKPKEFPHMALIGYGDKTDPDRTWGCGGSLISNRWILSAAHCAKTSDKTASWVRLGDLNIFSESEDAKPKEYDIVEIITHPDYSPSYVYNDIGLFRLETDVEFSAYVRPICLNANPSLRFKTATATGWGRISQGGQTSADLLKVNVQSIPFNQCKLSYPQSSRINLGLIEDQMVCAGDFNDGTKDTCSGDSGGPLQILNSKYVCMHTQVGITSFGKYCGSKDTAGVYTRVSYYVPWIERIVWPKF